MATQKPSDKPAKKKAPKKEPAAESYLSDEAPAQAGAEGADEAFDEAAQERYEARQAYKLKHAATPLPLSPEKEPREDVKRNRAVIRRVMLDFIQNERRAATKQEICAATGLSEKTVKGHLKHIRLGDGQANIYQALTHDVIMSIFKKAKGFSISSEKLITVAQGQFQPAQVERHSLQLYHAPDTSAAKLFMQLVEGFSEKSLTEHSGEVKGSGPGMVFNYIVPQPPEDAEN